MEYEYCQLCGMKTEKAGRADDSIYADLQHDLPSPIRLTKGDEIGPLCELCYDDLLQLGFIKPDK